MDKPTRITFDCSDAEMKLLEAERKKMQRVQGRVSMAAVIRALIWKAAK